MFPFKFEQKPLAIFYGHVGRREICQVPKLFEYYASLFERHCLRVSSSRLRMPESKKMTALLSSPTGWRSIRDNEMGFVDAEILLRVALFIVHICICRNALFGN